MILCHIRYFGGKTAEALCSKKMEVMARDVRKF
jgi:hypothetical protein